MVKLYCVPTKHYAMKAYWGNGGIVPRILDLGRFILRERAPGTHWVGRRVGPRAGLDAVVKR
jgi:hypothetical protein